MNILFLGHTDSTLSQMAKTLLRRLDPRLNVFSAGISPSFGIHPFTHKVMLELGLPLFGQKAETIDRLSGLEFDYVISFSKLPPGGARPKMTATGRFTQFMVPEPAEPAKGQSSQLVRFRVVRKLLSEIVTRLYFGDLRPAWEQRV